jgi:hypothetical protein
MHFPDFKVVAEADDAELTKGLMKVGRSSSDHLRLEMEMFLADGSDCCWRPTNNQFHRATPRRHESWQSASTPIMVIPLMDFQRHGRLDGAPHGPDAMRLG